MALYIVQHGQSLTRDIDPEKGLSNQGIETVKKIARVAQNYGVKVARIQHSGKKRALQTAELLAATLKPADGLQEVADIKPMDDVAIFASRVDYSANIMVVGHLPFLERLTSFLVIGQQSPIVFKLQNGGILCLDQIEHSDVPAIKWALMPQVE